MLLPPLLVALLSLFTVLQGVSYDHVELNFYLNGVSTNTPVTGFKGTVYPVLYGKRAYVTICNVCECVCVLKSK